MTQTGRRDALVMLLTAAAGATNVLSLTALGGVPASIMTANLVIAGLSFTHHEGALGWHAGVALAGFIVAVFIAARFIRAGGKDIDEAKRPVWPRPAAIALAAEAVSLAGVAVGWGVTGGRPAGTVQLILCATAAFAMGIQSAAVRALGVAGVTTTYITGTWTSLIGDVVRRLRRAEDSRGPDKPAGVLGASGRLQAAVVGVYVVAAVAGGAAESRWLLAAIALPAAAVALVVAVAALRFRSGAPTGDSPAPP
jgi:uncharacterized membrane protein YoaK (UPF0700 family)